MLKFLIRVIFFLALLICALIGVIYYLGVQPATTPTVTLSTPQPGQIPPGERVELINPPPDFTPREEYAAPPGTEVEGVGTIDNSFALLGTEKLEFVTGYTVDLPAEVGVGGYNLTNRPELILSMLITALKATGMANQETLTGLDDIGDDSIGLTFTTNREGMQLRVDAVIFHRGQQGALAAVIYVVGQQPSVQVEEVARQMDQRIQAEAVE